VSGEEILETPHRGVLESPSGLLDCACRDCLPRREAPRQSAAEGLPMPRYLTQHTLACLTRQGAENLAQRMQEGGPARAERVLVNMLEGKMFAEFRAETREALEAWLATQGMHFDWIVRIEWETREGKLEIAS
jgi:hypothetical protein